MQNEILLLEYFPEIPAVKCKREVPILRGDLKDYTPGYRIGDTEHQYRWHKQKQNRFDAVLLDCIFTIDGEDYVKTMPNGGDRIVDIERGIDNFREIHKSTPVSTLGEKYSWIQLAPIDYPKFGPIERKFVEIIYRENGKHLSMGHRLTKKELESIVAPLRKNKTLVAIKYKTPTKEQIELLG